MGPGGSSRRILGALLVGACALVTGCRREALVKPQNAVLAPLADAEARAAIESYNARAGSIGPIWARSVTNIWYPDRSGEERSDQAEGHFNYRPSSSLVLTFGKVGEVGAVLGSNAEQYWWAELRDPKRALLGTHARVDPARIRELGLPVQPLDLIDLLAFTPLPEPARASLSADGALVLEAPARSGVRRVILAAGEPEPTRVELRTDAGDTLLAADLSRYEPLAWRGKGASSAVRVPTEIVLTMDGGRVRARMRLSDPESGGSRPKLAAFEFKTWAEGYGLKDVTDLDAAR